MKKIKLLTIFTFTFLVCGFTFGQTQTSMADSINNRLTNLISSSNSFKQYKVIKTSRIQALRKDIHTQVKTLEDDIAQLNKELKGRNTKLSALQQKLNTANKDLKAAIKSKGQLAMFGIDLQKSTYNTIVLIVFLGLLISLFFFIFKFKRSNQITLEAKDLLHRNEKEFDHYKKKALATQQKLGRQIMDERKKANRKVTVNA